MISHKILAILQLRLSKKSRLSNRLTLWLFGGARGSSGTPARTWTQTKRTTGVQVPPPVRGLAQIGEPGRQRGKTVKKKRGGRPHCVDQHLMKMTNGLKSPTPLHADPLYILRNVAVVNASCRTESENQATQAEFAKVETSDGHVNVKQAIYHLIGLAAYTAGLTGCLVINRLTQPQALALVPDIKSSRSVTLIKPLMHGKQGISEPPSLRKGGGDGGPGQPTGPRIHPPQRKCLYLFKGLEIRG